MEMSSFSDSFKRIAFLDGFLESISPLCETLENCLGNCQSQLKTRWRLFNFQKSYELKPVAIWIYPLDIYPVHLHWTCLIMKLSSRILFTWIRWGLEPKQILPSSLWILIHWIQLNSIGSSKFTDLFFATNCFQKFQSKTTVFTFALYQRTEILFDWFMAPRNLFPLDLTLKLQFQTENFNYRNQTSEK